MWTQKKRETTWRASWATKSTEDNLKNPLNNVKEPIQLWTTRNNRKHTYQRTQDILAQAEEHRAINNS